MKHFRTNDIIEAARELARDHSIQYAEDCVKAALKYKLIDIDQFTAVLRILYKAA